MSKRKNTKARAVKDTDDSTKSHTPRPSSPEETRDSVPERYDSPYKLQAIAQKIRSFTEDLAWGRDEPLDPDDKARLCDAAVALEGARLDILVATETVRLRDFGPITRKCVCCGQLFQTFRSDQVGCSRHRKLVDRDDIEKLTYEELQAEVC